MKLPVFFSTTRLFRLEKEVERHQIKFNRDSTFIHGEAASSSKSAGVVTGSRKAATGYASAVKRGAKTDATPSAASAAPTRKPASLLEGVEEATSSSATPSSSSRGAWGDASASGANGSDGDAEKDREYLEMRIAGLLDENEALQKTLEATLAAKKQDLALLQEMMTQTKSIFLKAMKEMRGS